jgi:hypothetical protein
VVITINVSDAVATRVINALCTAGGKSTVNAANAKAVLLDMVMQTVQSVETRAAMVPPPTAEPIAGLS